MEPVRHLTTLGDAASHAVFAHEMGAGDANVAESHALQGCRALWEVMSATPPKSGLPEIMRVMAREVVAKDDRSAREDAIATRWTASEGLTRAALREPRAWSTRHDANALAHYAEMVLRSDPAIVGAEHLSATTVKVEAVLWRNGALTASATPTYLGRAKALSPITLGGITLLGAAAAIHGGCEIAEFTLSAMSAPSPQTQRMANDRTMSAFALAIHHMDGQRGLDPIAIIGRFRTRQHAAAQRTSP